MILLVTGGRDFCEARDGADHMNERRALGWALDYIKPDRVMHGDCPTGADRWAQIWCERRGVPSDRYPADWSKGKRAGPDRNQRMVDKRPDAAVSFPGGNGTADCVRRCEAAGVPIFEASLK
jgi:hypothetical protein